MLTKKQITQLRGELKTAKNPLFIHDGDADGLGAFLLLYRMYREGRSTAMTGSSVVDIRMMRKVEELNPDKIFILDVPVVQQDFIDAANRPIFWVDHHPPLDRHNITYFNPRIKDPDAYVPTTRMAWQVSNNSNDLWIAAAGTLADWSMPNFIGKFIKKYPSYLAKKEDLPTTVFKRPVGKLVKFLFFIQKGPSNEVRKSIKVLTRIEHPDEIFKETTPSGKFLHKRFKQINGMYENLLKKANKSVTRSRLVLFYYTEQQWSFTANLANELSGRHQDKFIIIARNKSGEMKCSLRGKDVLTYLQNALQGVEGRGGGHPDACGAVVKEEDWETFLANFKAGLKK
jgi:single-stranded DNA-specific DHH superfamily exonuclease